MVTILAQGRSQTAGRRCNLLDVSATHPIEIGAAFAVRFLRHLADGDLAAAEGLIDLNDTGAPFTESFLAPVPGPGGFSYADPNRMTDWSMHVLGANELGFGLDFEVPFAEEEYAGRALMARFDLRRVGDKLQVRLTGAVPN